MSDLPAWSSAVVARLSAYDGLVGVFDFLFVVNGAERAILPSRPAPAHRDIAPPPRWCVKTALRLSHLRNNGVYDISLVLGTSEASLVIKNPHQPYNAEALGGY